MGGKGAYGIIINTGGSGTGQAVSPQVLYNTITNLQGHWAHGIGLEGDTPGAVVENNLISNLTDTKVSPEIPDAVGVMVEDNDNAGNVDIHNNSFTSMDLGVRNMTSFTVRCRMQLVWLCRRGCGHRDDLWPCRL
jgi:hypothetical protein